jgi:hypothetical protein
MPSFKLIVEGNIYVSPAVTRLDGVYRAQPPAATPGKGNFYTCANGFTPMTLGVAVSAGCGNQLTVNGAVSARQVWLLRTAGTVSAATAAETFNFVPETWVNAAFGSVMPEDLAGYDSLSNLPPVL